MLGFILHSVAKSRKLQISGEICKRKALMDQACGRNACKDKYNLKSAIDDQIYNQ
jgi:hypothetical protein